MTARHWVLMFVFAPAAVAADVPPELLACMDKPDDEVRLRCFEAYVHAAGATAASATDPSEPAGTDAPSGMDDGESLQESLESEFGKEARLDEERARLAALDATVVAVDVRSGGMRVFELDNGQVWAEQSANERLKVEPGHDVRIRAASLGSFRLTVIGARVSTRVERIR